MGPKIPQLTEEEAIWTATRAGGAVISDGALHDAELKFLDRYYDLMQHADPVSQACKDALMRVKVPAQEPLKTTAKKSEKIFRFILQALTSDLEIGEKEVAFALQTAILLGLSEKEARPALSEAVEFLRLEFFLRLMARLDSSQLEWLALVVVKLVYADGKVTPTERAYLNHLSYLLGQDYAKLRYIRGHFQNHPIDEINTEGFSHGLSLQVSRYLIEIALQGHSLEPKALGLALQVGRHLGLKAKELEQVKMQSLALLPLMAPER